MVKGKLPTADEGIYGDIAEYMPANPGEMKLGTNKERKKGPYFDEGRNEVV